VNKVAKGRYVKEIPYNEGCLRKPRLNRVIVLDDLNYYWPRKHLRWLRELKAKGYSVQEITKYFARDPDEVLIALIHLATSEKDRIEYPVVILLEHLDFLWDWWELRELSMIWEQELSVKYAAKYFNRPVAEIMLANMHLARIDKIKRRRGGLF
jgi:hypothetical protein